MSTDEDRDWDYQQDRAMASSLGLDYDEYMGASDAQIAEAKGWEPVTVWVEDVRVLRTVLKSSGLDYVEEE